MFNFLNRNKEAVLHVNDIDEVLGGIEVIDVREPYEFRTRALMGAKNIPMQTLLSNTERYLKKDKEYHLICQSGSRSGMTCRKLKGEGYNVINIAGGMGSYVGTKLK